MATYTQWRTAADRGEVRHATWVCGDQHILVEEVVDTIRYLLKVRPQDAVTLHAGGNDVAVWAEAHQDAIDPGSNRLVLVRDADKVRNWAPLAGWMSNLRTVPNSYLLFVSGEPDLPKKSTAHIEALKPPKAHVVRCTMPNPIDARSWVMRRAHLDERTAEHLLTRVGMDLAAAAAVCRKMSIFNAAASPAAIDRLCEPLPADAFAEHLLWQQKPDALLALQRLHATDYSRTIGLLDSRLETLDILHRALRAGHKTREVQGLPYFLTRLYSPIAKHYDPATVDRRRTLLTLIDSALRSGARTGVMEALAALW